MSSSQDAKSPKGPESPENTSSPQAKSASPEAGPAPLAMVPLTAEEIREAGILPGTHWTQQPVNFTFLPATVLNVQKLILICPV